MNKTLLVSALVLGLAVPAYAEQFDNKGDSRYESPQLVQERQESGTVERTEKEKGEQLPIHLTGDHAEYDSVSGDFHASGNVVVTQGTEKLLTTYAYGNMKTGDVWLEQGGTVVEPNIIISTLKPERSKKLPAKAARIGSKPPTLPFIRIKW